MSLWDEYKAMLADTGDIFADYIRHHAPPEVREFASLADSDNGDPWDSLTKAIEKAKNKKKKLSEGDVAILWAGLLSLADLSGKGVDNIPPQQLPILIQLKGLFSAGLIKYCARLLAEEQDEQYRAIRKHLTETAKDVIAMEAGVIAQQKNARQGTTRRQNSDRAIVIQQWEKFTGDKATAATFARIFCEGRDQSAKPEQHHDIITREPLPGMKKAYTNKKISDWINRHLEGK